MNVLLAILVTAGLAMSAVNSMGMTTNAQMSAHAAAKLATAGSRPCDDCAAGMISGDAGASHQSTSDMGHCFNGALCSSLVSALSQDTGFLGPGVSRSARPDVPPTLMVGFNRSPDPYPPKRH